MTRAASLPLPAPAVPADPRQPRAFLGLDAAVWGGVVAFWTMMWLVDGAKTFLSPNSARDLRNPVGMLLESFQWWFLWVPFTVLVFALARRFPLGGRHALRNALLHVAFSIPVSLAKTSVGAALFWHFFLRHRFAGIPVSTPVGNFIKLFFVSGVGIYLLLVGTYSALHYHRRLREREREAARLALRAAQLETSVTEARLNALRMELNPHFLFNSLNSVSGLVRRGEPEHAVEMLATLGDLLRVTLGQKEQEVPLEMEMDFLRRYLRIERIRWHDRLTVEEDVPPALLSVPVPTLVLQPLVENAVRHGIARHPGPGRIVVRAAREGDQVVLEVRDTGAGVDGAVRGTGVGLANTRERLAQLYGGRASLALEPAPGGGTRALVRLPAPPDDAHPAES